MTRYGFAILACTLGIAAAAPASAAPPCGDPAEAAKPDTAFAVLIKTPGEARALAAGKAVLARVGSLEGGGDPVAWPAETLKKLRLAPGSEVAGIEVKKGSLEGWAAPGVRFTKVDFSGTSLAGADVSGACFDHGVFNETDFSRAKLHGAQFDGAELAGAVFDGADLSGARLECLPGFVAEGCYTGASGGDQLRFRNADLRGADIARQAEMFGAVLDGAVIERTKLAFSDDLLPGLAGARVTSVLLVPPAMRAGDPQLFSADDLARLKTLGGRPTALIRTLGAEPGFDCAAARKTPVEETICQRDELKALDQLMSQSYRRRVSGAADKPAVQAAQLAFLKTRNACAAVAADDRSACIGAAYLARLAEFGAEYAAAARSAGKRQLVDLPTALVPAVKDDPLAKRLLLANGASPNTATLEPKGATLALDATSIGTNGHTCSFEGELKWDAAKKAWVGGEDPQLSWLILPEGLVLASSFEDGRQLCGMRASWPVVFFVPPAG